MNLRSRTLTTLAIAASFGHFAGCGTESTSNAGPSGSPTASSNANAPADVESNITRATASEAASTPAEAKPAETPATEPANPESAPVEPKALSAVVPAAPAAPAQTDGVKLTPAKWDEYTEFVKPKDGKKFTLVDAWATWCAPCKENFPHVVEMHEKYASKGLQVISLSLDDVSDAKAVKEATEFLVSKKAAFTNLILNETQEIAFDKLEISAIPSVFLFDAQGKEIHRFTLEDPNDQFTYEQVEQAIQAILDGKPVPDFKKSK
jgi:thiol-disulfide isomerase/thioredoxin